MKIKVLGPGCPSCQQAENIIRDTLSEEDFAADLEKVTDIKEIAKYGVLVTPAVIIDGKVKSVGKIPSKTEIKTWIGK